MAGSSRLGLPDDWIEIDKRLSLVENQLSVRAAANPFVSPTTAPKRVRTRPPAVSGIGLSAVAAPGVIQITWAAVPIQDLRYYEVQFSVFQTFFEPQIFTTVNTSFTFTGGILGTTYYARVRAINSIGQVGDWSPVLNSTTGQTVSLGGSGVLFSGVLVGRTNYGTNAPIENYDSFNPADPGANDYLITEFDGLGREILPFTVFTFQTQIYFPTMTGGSALSDEEAAVNQLIFSIWRKEDPNDTAKWFQIGTDVVVDYKFQTNNLPTPNNQTSVSGLVLPFTPPAGTWPYYLRIRAVSSASSFTNTNSVLTTENMMVNITPLGFDLRFIRI